MSGFLSQVSAVSDVLFGASGGVTLGSVTFSGFELPASIPWGGAQSVRVHKLPGGGRVIDAMGRDDHAISWSGMFLSPDAATRALLVDEMRVAGQPVTLSWGAHVYSVVISDFTSTDMAPGRVDYRVSCELLYDLSATLSDQPPTLLGQVLDDLSSATGIGLPAALSGASTALQTAQQGARAISVLTGGSSASVALLANLGVAQGALAGVSGAANGALGALGGASNLLGTTDPLQAAGALSAAVGNSGIAAAGQAALGYVGRAVSNITGALP